MKAWLAPRGDAREKKTMPGTAAEEWQPLRWPVDMSATVQEHRGCAFTIQVVDISATGCRIWAGFHLTPGRAAKVAMGGFAPFAARVIWSADWYAALAFDQPLHHSVLRHLVERHPARPDAATAPSSISRA